MGRCSHGSKGIGGLARKALACMASVVLTAGLMPGAAWADGEDATVPQKVSESHDFNSVKVNMDNHYNEQNVLLTNSNSGNSIIVNVAGGVEGQRVADNSYLQGLYVNQHDPTITTVNVGGQIEVTQSAGTGTPSAQAVNVYNINGTANIAIKGAVVAKCDHGNAGGVRLNSHNSAKTTVSAGSVDVSSDSGHSSGIYFEDRSDAPSIVSVAGLVHVSGEGARGLYVQDYSKDKESLVTVGEVTAEGKSTAYGVHAIIYNESSLMTIVSNGDVTATAKKANGTSVGAYLDFRDTGGIDLFVDGTLKGNTAGVAVEEKDQGDFDPNVSSITAWKIEAGEGGYVAAKKTGDGFSEYDALAKAIKYIVKVKQAAGSLESQAAGTDQPLAGNLRVVKADGSELDKSHDKLVAKEGDKIYLNVDKGYMITSASNGNDGQVVQKDADGNYFIVVKRGGGIDLQAVVEQVAKLVTFKNDDGTVLQSSEVYEGEMPAYTGETPTKAATDQYAYEFDAWSPALSPVKAAATYVATYKASTREYSMSFDLGGGTVDGKSTYTVAAAYGSTITLPTPVREGYEFLYWEGSRYYGGDLYKVEGPHSFKAVWKEKEPAPEPKPAESKATTAATGGSMPATGDALPLAAVMATLLTSAAALAVSRGRLRAGAGRHARR